MNMNLIDLIGLLGSIGVGFSLFPQTYKVIRFSKIESLSFGFILSTFISSILQIIYGVYYFILPTIIANSCVLFNALILLIFFIKNKLVSSTI